MDWLAFQGEVERAMLIECFTKWKMSEWVSQRFLD